MIDVKNRIPTPGKEGRVRITQDGGGAIEGILSMHDDATEPGSPWNRRTAQLLQADIRTHPIAPGNTVSAGDVVDVVGGEVGETWVANPNVKSVFVNAAVSNMGMAAMANSLSVACYAAGSNSSAAIFNGGAFVTGRHFNIGNAAQNISCGGLSGSKFAVQCTISNELIAYAAIFDGTVIQPYGAVAVISSGTTNYNVMVPLTETTFLSVYNRSGMKAKVCAVPAITITPGTESALPGSTSASYISATRLPNAPNDDKRVCVCYSDAADGNKGKAVIATINASNVVSWGTPIVFAPSINQLMGCCQSDGDVIVTYNPPEITPVYRPQTLCLLNISGSAITANDPVVTSFESNERGSITKVGNRYVVSMNRRTPGEGISFAVERDGNTLIIGVAFVHNAVGGGYPASVATGATTMLLCYADNGNSNYGTATLLTVKGDQIAGSFTDASSQAIALQSGTEGQSIDIIYDGVAELPGITAGTQITSPGVQGYAPQDGWLWVRPEWENEYGTKFVYGSYTGNGTAATRSISLGFKPKMLYIFGTFSVSTDVNGLALVWPEAYVTVGSNGTVDFITSYFAITNEGFNRLANAALQWNQSGKVYKYLAVI